MAITLAKDLRLVVYILLFITSYISSFKTIEVESEENEYPFTLNKNQTFQVTFKNNDYDYYKIGLDDKIVTDNQYVISFYQNDSEFKERNQFSQGSSRNIEMWLNKAQVGNEFYIEVETNEVLPVPTTLTLKGYNNTELGIDKQYTYYVSEENKIMTFIIKNISTVIEEILDDINNYTVTIWAKGNKQIKSELKGDNVDDTIEKPSDLYNYYRINMADLKGNYLNFIVEAEKDDLVNVGTLLLHKEKDENGNEIYITRDISNILDNELTGFLKPNERVGFKYLKEKSDNIPFGYFPDINNNLQNFKYLGDQGNVAEFIQVFTSSEESFYAIQFPPRTLLFDNYHINYPQIIGVNYVRMISAKKQIGILPMKLDDFNFLTYENIQIAGEIEVSIFQCENYPLCSPSDNENIDKISDYGTFSHTFSNDEWDNTISPMSKNQKMLLVSCKNGINLQRKFCVELTNIKTDKNIIPIQFLLNKLPANRYIRKGDVNQYSIQYNHEVYMNIEILSGEVEINTNPETKNKFEIEKQKKLFIFPANKAISLTVKASKDSIYRIFDNYDIINDNNYLVFGSNYLFNLDKTIIIKPYGYLEQYIDYDKYYLGIYPFDNCKFTVESFEDDKQNITFTKLNRQFGFYQDILTDLSISYKITKLKSTKSPCLFYTSTYRLNNKLGITLEDNSYQTFLFNNDNSKFTFSYPYTQNDDNVIIYFSLLKGGSYTVEITLNDKEYKYDSTNTINSNKKIELEASTLKKECEDFNSICKIIISVLSNIKSESILTIGINNDEVPIEEEEPIDDGEEEKGGEEEKSREEEGKSGEEENSGKEEEEKRAGDDDDDDDNKVLIVCLCCGGVVIIILIIVIVLCRTKHSNKNLADTVNKISFEDEDGRDKLL